MQSSGSNVFTAMVVCGRSEAVLRRLAVFEDSPIRATWNSPGHGARQRHLPLACIRIPCARRQAEWCSSAEVISAERRVWVTPAAHPHRTCTVQLWPALGSERVRACTILLVALGGQTARIQEVAGCASGAVTKPPTGICHATSSTTLLTLSNRSVALVWASMHLLCTLFWASEYGRCNRWRCVRGKSSPYRCRTLRYLPMPHEMHELCPFRRLDAR